MLTNIFSSFLFFIFKIWEHKNENGVFMSSLDSISFQTKKKEKNVSQINKKNRPQGRKRRRLGKHNVTIVSVCSPYTAKQPKSTTKHKSRTANLCNCRLFRHSNISWFSHINFYICCSSSDLFGIRFPNAWILKVRCFSSYNPWMPSSTSSAIWMLTLKSMKISIGAPFLVV